MSSFGSYSSGGSATTDHSTICQFREGGDWMDSLYSSPPSSTRSSSSSSSFRMAGSIFAHRAPDYQDWMMGSPFDSDIDSDWDDGDDDASSLTNSTDLFESSSGQPSTKPLSSSSKSDDEIPAFFTSGLKPCLKQQSSRDGYRRVSWIEDDANLGPVSELIHYNPNAPTIGVHGDDFKTPRQDSLATARKFIGKAKATKLPMTCNKVVGFNIGPSLDEETSHVHLQRRGAIRRGQQQQQQEDDGDDIPLSSSSAGLQRREAIRRHHPRQQQQVDDVPLYSSVGLERRGAVQRSAGHPNYLQPLARWLGRRRLA